MAKKSFDQDIELKSLNKSEAENKSDYDNNDPSDSKNDFDAEEDVSEPFISNKSLDNSEDLSEKSLSKKNEIPLRNIRKHGEDKTDGDSAEVESLLVQETTLDGITVEPGTETGQPAGEISPAEIEQGPEPNERGIQPSEAYARLVELLKPSKRKLVILLCALVIIASTLFLVIFVPNSIFSIEYDKMALSRNKWTGSVDDENTYLPGLHLMLPWKEWIIFRKSAMNIQLNNMPIFTKDALSVNTSFGIFFLYDPENLGKFYRKFGEKNHTNLLRSVMRSEIMNDGLKFSIEDFRTKRAFIVKSLREKVVKRLKNDYFINVLSVFMEKISFTEKINSLNLLVVLNGVYNEKAFNEQQSEFVSLKTKVMVNKIQNEAKLELQKADLVANYTVIEVAKTQANFMLEMSYLKKLTQSLKELNFFTDKVKTKAESQRAMSFCYLSSLINTNSSVNYYAPRDGLAINTAAHGYLSGASGLITM